MAMNNNEKDICFEIKERIGVVKEYPTGWAKELNLVSWNGREQKYDIRDFAPDHEHSATRSTVKGCC